MRGVRCCWMRIVRAILFVIGGGMVYGSAYTASVVMTYRSVRFSTELIDAKWEGRWVRDTPDMFSTPSMVIPGCVAFAGLSLQAVAVFAGGGSRERPAHGYRPVA